MDAAPTLREFLAAHRVIAEFLPATPLAAASPLLAHGAQLFTKHENLTPVGSFKIRGAFYRVSLLDEREREAGVVTASTGNHGMAVAYAARELGTSAVVIVPENASRVKVERTERLGAVVRRVGRSMTEAEEAARAVAAAKGRVLIEDGYDPDLALGAGTISLEIVRSLPEADVLLVPVGGGNLIAGMSRCAKLLNPDITIVGVQSEAAPATYESWRSGRVVHMVAETFAGGLAADQPGEYALTLLRECVDEIVLVSEEDLREAMVLALAEVGQVLEGAGGAALAAVRRYSERWRGKVVVALLTGGNVDREELYGAIVHTTRISPLACKGT